MDERVCNSVKFTANTVTRTVCAAQTKAIVAKHVTGCFIFSMIQNYRLLLELHTLTQAAHP